MNHLHLSKQKKVKYNDVLLFLILIPPINTINYFLTYEHIAWNWKTFLTFTIDTIEGYIAWLILRTIIFYLDKKIPYQHSLSKRLLIQLILTTFFVLGIIILLTELVNWIAATKPVPIDFYQYDVLIFFIWILVVNGIYIGIYFFKHWQDAEKEKKQHAILLQQEIELRQKETRIRHEGFIVKVGKQNTSIAFNELIGIYIEGDYTVACILNGKKYLMDESLDSLEKSLPIECFFRVNRQYILHRQAIKGFNRIENSKLAILLHPSLSFPESIIISRLRAPIFKKWFQEK